MSAYKHSPFRLSPALTVSRCISTCLRTIRLSAERLPAGRNTQSINEVYAMGVFRSQTPRALINAACNNYCPAYAFHLGRIRPFYLPVSGLYPFQLSPCLPSTGACHAPVLITNGSSPALLVCPDTLFSPVPVLPLSWQF